MQENAYRALAQHEPQGWYYQARVRAVKTLIREFLPRASGLEILDVGCGTGGTSHALEELGCVTGLEPSALAIEILHANYPRLRVVRGSVDEVPALFDRQCFDLATIMGVLYHVKVIDPVTSLANIRQAIKPGGWIVWNEAVYPWLARQHDDFVHAGRRFYPRQMHRMLSEAGFEVRFGSHLLAWAFPVAVALAAAHRARQLLSRVLHLKPAADPADDRHLPAFFNAALGQLTYAEWYAALKMAKLPFGVSYLVIAQNASAAIERPASIPRRQAA
jgi:SAM-dependent methyltransferase